jgi:hypothetical protein
VVVGSINIVNSFRVAQAVVIRKSTLTESLFGQPLGIEQQ